MIIRYRSNDNALRAYYNSAPQVCSARIFHKDRYSLFVLFIQQKAEDFTVASATISLLTYLRFPSIIKGKKFNKKGGYKMKRLITLFLCVICFLTLIGCQKTLGQYDGTPLLILKYETVDYNGGWTNTYIFDFENNRVQQRSYLTEEDEETEFNELATFSDDEETLLINSLYSYGLFDIKDNYPSSSGVMDGGGWSLIIEYSDGTTKESMGSNNSPSSVFSDCAKAFYLVCGEGVVSSVPQEYYCPPNVSYAFKSGTTSSGYTSYGKRVDYKWNGFESVNNNVYDANVSAEFLQNFYEGTEYTLALYTANYGKYDNYDKFIKCIVSSYDFNENLTNPTVVHNGGWFTRIELELQLNRIYKIRFEFDNGDFVEYTFNTKTTLGD